MSLTGRVPVYPTIPHMISSFVLGFADSVAHRFRMRECMSAEVAHPLNKRIFLVNDGIGGACSTSRPPRPSTCQFRKDEQEIERVHQNEDFPNKPRPNRADQPERRR
mgnify:CR=1 FL=1